MELDCCESCKEIKIIHKHFCLECWKEFKEIIDSKSELKYYI